MSRLIVGGGIGFHGEVSIEPKTATGVSEGGMSFSHLKTERKFIWCLGNSLYVLSIWFCQECN